MGGLTQRDNSQRAPQAALQFPSTDFSFKEGDKTILLDVHSTMNGSRVFLDINKLNKIPSLPSNYEYRIWHVNADSHTQDLDVKEYTGINRDSLKDVRPAEFTAKIRFY